MVICDYLARYFRGGGADCGVARAQSRAFPDAPAIARDRSAPARSIDSRGCDVDGKRGSDAGVADALAIALPRRTGMARFHFSPRSDQSNAGSTLHLRG